MGGGLLQLVAYGSQDIYLTGNPQITFFKAVYRRHTNFSIESIKQTFNGTVNFGEEVSVTLQRNADLVHKMYLQIKLPSVDISKTNSDSTTHSSAFRWLNWIGHVLLKEVEISIGGQKIDKHYGEWLHIWNELSQTPGRAPGYAEMVGNVPKLTQIYGSKTTTSTNPNPSGEFTLYIPLQFWFCRNPGMALPLIALQYNDIVLNFSFRTFNDCIWAAKKTNTTLYNPPTTTPYTYGSDIIDLAEKTIQSNTQLYVDYIYLDTDERRRFAQVPHEYLIEQLQYNGEESVTTTNVSIKMNFTHPVKEIIWVTQPINYRKRDFTNPRAGHQYFNYTDHWDYSGFNGTPEASCGPGMVGGRGVKNISFGNPMIKNVKPSTTYTNITKLQLTADITDGINGSTGVPNINEFNIVKFNDGVSHPPTVTLVACEATKTHFLSVNGTSTSSLLAKSLKVGDTHLLTIEEDADKFKTTLAKVTHLYKKSGDVSVSSGIGPVASDQIVTDLSTPTNIQPANGTLIIRYDKVINTTTTITDGAKLRIQTILEDPLNNYLYDNGNLHYNPEEFIDATNGIMNLNNTEGETPHTDTKLNMKNQTNSENLQYINLLDTGENCTKEGNIVLNGNDRFSTREGKYFNLVQPYQHHTNCPAPGINVYSFAITPEDHQPSGTCNFSRIDNAHLNLTLTDNTISSHNGGSAIIKVYAINYNILRIMSGMGGLAYSN